MSRYLVAILRAVEGELKTGAVVMLIMIPIGLLVAPPVALAVVYLPEWAWWALFGAGFLWMMFGDAVMGAIRREAQKKAGGDHEQ